MSRRWARGAGAMVIAALLVPAVATPAGASTSVTLRSGSVSPSTITGGDSAVQTIRLSGPAPAGGVYISLYSELVYGASTGRQAVVPAGATSVTFPFRTAAPATEVVRPLYAQVNGSPLVKIAEVTILPADPSVRAVRELRINADAAVVGATLQGTVELNNPAPAGGITVSLWSNTHYGPGVYVPPYVTVPAGSSTATFPVTVTRADEPGIVRPSADLGTSIASRELVVVPAHFAVSSGLANRATTTRFAVGIGTAPNPTGTTVALTSDTPGVTMPATVTVPAGSPGVSFPVTVSDSVPRSALGYLTATWNGVRVSSYFITD